MSSSRATQFMQRRSDLISVGVVGAHLTFVLAPVFAAAYWGSLAWLLAGYLWFGLTQNSIANLMHEAAHRMVFHKPRWSDALGHGILAPFFLTDFERYRRRHWVHHCHTGTKDDTKEAYLIEVRGVIGLLSFVARCLIGLEAVRRFTGSLKKNEHVAPLTSVEARRGLVCLVVFQAVLAGALFLTALWASNGQFFQAVLQSLLAYGVVYIYGMMTWTILLSTLRAIAEHQIVPGDESAVEPGSKAAIRNLAPTLISRALLGSYGFCEHGTHHTYPTVPYYRLTSATATLSTTNPALAYGSSYWGVLARAIIR